MADNAPVALVTGAGSGIGLEAASMLAREGYRVALVGRDRSKLERAAEAIARAGSATAQAAQTCIIAADLAAAEACQGIVDETVRVLGRLDALVNNAGWTPLKPIPDLDAATVRTVFEINAIGPVLTTVAAVKQFGRQAPLARAVSGGRGPCIVNVSSRSSTDPFVGLGVYGAAKAAVNTLALAVARECPGVRAFAVAPGAVETPLLRSMFPESVLPPERCLPPADVARVILDCVLGAYDGQNGQTIVVPSP